MSIIVTTPDFDYETSDNSWTTVAVHQAGPGQTLSIDATAMARKENSADAALWHITGLYRRDGSGPLQLVGSLLNIITPIKTAGAILWDFRVTVEEDEYIYIAVKGASGANVGWYLSGEVTIMTYPT